jgi:predicted glycosyltransferase
MVYAMGSPKIWFDIGTPFNCNLVHAIIKNLGDSFETLITCRDHDAIIDILSAKKMEFHVIGKHGGKELKGKLKAYAERVTLLADLVEKEKPTLLVTERDPSAVRTAFGLGVPAWTVFYDEREYWTNWMVFPLSDKIFVPNFYDDLELVHNGVNLNKVTWFNGFHTAFLKDLWPQLKINNSSQDKLRILIRPEFEFATFFNTKKPLLERVVSLLLELDYRAEFLVFPRTESQREVFSNYPVNFIQENTMDCPVINVDLVIGAAETMLMEAFVLLKPAISCVYWNLSKPVQLLHRYIDHSTNPREVVHLATKYFDRDEREKFSYKAKEIVNKMDNLGILIANEAKKLFSLY